MSAFIHHEGHMMMVGESMRLFITRIPLAALTRRHQGIHHTDRAISSSLIKGFLG
jgi:hypothetical protein